MLSGPHPRETLYRLPTYDQGRARTVVRVAWITMIFDLLASLLVAGSWLGHRWGNLPGLGRPWLRFGAYPEPRVLAVAGAASAAVAVLLAIRGTRAAGVMGLAPVVALYLAGVAPLYPFSAYLRWSARFHHLAPLAPALDRAAALLVATLGGLAAATAAFAIGRLRGLAETGDTHGSSHWASARDVRASGLLGASGGVTVGAWRGRGGRLWRLGDAGDRHVLAFAPSGAGKTTCLVVPTLLEWRGSAVVLDIKGELWRHTAGYRRERLGQRCIRFDPSAADGRGASYNPLLVIPRGGEDVKYAQSVADVLVDPEGRDQPRTFWEQSAHALLVATALHVLHGERRKSLAGCAALLSDPRRPVGATLEAMLGAEHDPGLGMGWRESADGARTATHPVVAAAARALLDMDARTSSGVIATAQSHLDLFRDPILAANTEASDFTAADLVGGERPVTLYLTVPPAEIERLRPVMRLMLNQLCRQLTGGMAFERGRRGAAEAGRRGAAEAARQGATEAAEAVRQGFGGGMDPGGARMGCAGARGAGWPLLLMLDEFTALGRLDFFGRAMAYLRGFGIRVFLSVQSLAQLYDTYGQHQSISANCALQVAFAPADVETAELLSRMSGQMTVGLTRRSLAGNLVAFAPRRTTISRQEVGRPLLTPEEVRRLPEGEALVFAAGWPAIRAARVPYYRDRRMAAMAAMPWPEWSDRIERGSEWGVSGDGNGGGEEPMNQ